MKLGVIFPQTEIGNDPTAIRDYAQAVEGAGFDYLETFEHVLGVDPQRPGGFTGAYNAESAFHEPMVLFGYLAAVTTTLELVTGVLVLPQRQTALVAKQATEVDVLSGGRLRLGIGIGWNAPEFEALGQNFHNRGRRVEEQIALLRALWSKPTIAFEGRDHRLTHVGINPRPPRGTIPIWIGGHHARVLDRAGRLADGWLPIARQAEDLTAGIERIRAAARAAGRELDGFGVGCRVGMSSSGIEAAAERARALEAAGATHVAVLATERLGPPAQHIDALRRFAEACGRPRPDDAPGARAARPRP